MNNNNNNNNNHHQTKTCSKQDLTFAKTSELLFNNEAFTIDLLRISSILLVPHPTLLHLNYVTITAINHIIFVTIIY